MTVPRLHPDTVEQVRQRVDIVDLVSEQVVLKKQGKDFVGLCPFHDDKSPSFSVSPSKQFYYCFSCGAGGNAFKFLMELNKQSFSEVVLDLARRYQIQVRTLEPEQRQALQQQLSLRDQLYEITSITAKFYEHALRQSQGVDALEYLRTTRQLQDATIQQFQLGYAPASWQTLYGYLVEQKHYPVDLVEQAGLIIPQKSGNGYYDRFRDRLMIPIHDLQGRVIGFGGRAFGDAQPKYLNSPETPLFDKGKTLFALEKARSAIAKQDRAVVVEGYFDAIALHAAGQENVVASLGTALSLGQVRQLLRYTESKQIVLNFDADAAGARAAERAIGEVADLAYRGEVKLRVLNIPDGKDPDEFLKAHTPKEYEELVNQAPLWLDWQIEKLLTGRDLSQADHLQQATQSITDLLGNLTDAPLRTHYIHQCAELLSRGNASLMLQLEDDLRTQVRGQRWHGRSKKWQTSSNRSLLEEAEAQLIRLYLHVPDYRHSIVQALDERDVDFKLAQYRFLWQQLMELESQLEAGQDLLGQLRDRCTEFPDHSQQVFDLFQLDEKVKRDILRAPLVIRAATACMEQVTCEKRCRHLQKLWEETTDRDLSAHYQRRIYAEKQRIQELQFEQRSVSFEDLAQIPWIGDFYDAIADDLPMDESSNTDDGMDTDNETHNNLNNDALDISEPS